MHFPALIPRHLVGLVASIVCAAALIPVAALAATASPHAPATAAHTSAKATSIPSVNVVSVTLVANGAAIRVAFTAACGAGDDGILSSTSTQAVGDHVAQGATGNVFKCTGKPQQMSALAAANVAGAPFRPGIAVVQASLSDCPGANCAGASTDKVLSIRR
jgi:hypothetical protein